MTPREACCLSAIHSRGSAVDLASSSSVVIDGVVAEAANPTSGRDGPETSLHDFAAGNVVDDAASMNLDAEAFADDLGRNVPGSNASDIRIEATWHAMSRQVVHTLAIFCKPCF